MPLTTFAVAEAAETAWETFARYAELPARLLGLIALGLVLRWLVFRSIDRMLKRITAPVAKKKLTVESKDDSAAGTPDGSTVVTPGGSTAEKRVRASSKLRNGLRNGLVNPRQTQRATALGSLLKSLTTGVIGVVVGLMVLSTLGFDLAPFLASAGVAGVAVGFGAQSLVKDLVSGVFMLLEDQFGVGDYVVMNEITGTVESVGLRITRVRDDYGTLWSIRNGEVLQVGNKSMAWVAVMISVRLNSDQDVEEASRIVDEVGREVAAAHPGKVLDAPVALGVTQMSGNTTTVLVYGRVRQETDRWGVERDLRIRYKRRFDEAGIRMPEVDLYATS